MMKGMELLWDKIVWDHKYAKVPFKTLLRDKKILLLYYTSSSCAEADEPFLPKLKKIYKESQQRKLGVEIVFVSLDNSEKDMKTLFTNKHGPWYAIPFEDGDINKELQMKYNITSIPAIVTIKVSSGQVISRNGKQEIEQLGINVLATWCG